MDNKLVKITAVRGAVKILSHKTQPEQFMKKKFLISFGGPYQLFGLVSRGKTIRIASNLLKFKTVHSLTYYLKPPPCQKLGAEAIWTSTGLDFS